MEEKNNETIIQMPLDAKHRGQLEADAKLNDRTLARQAAWIVKRFYDGFIVETLPGMNASCSVPRS